MQLRRTIIIITLSIPFFWGCSVSEPQSENQTATENQSQADSALAAAPVQASPVDSLNDVILTQPNNPELYVARAELKVQERDRKGAMADLERAIAIDSLNPDPYVLLATLKFQSKKVEEATQLLTKAKAIDPNHVATNLKLAELYMVASNFEEAFNHVNTVLRADVYNAEAYFLKGMIYKFAGDTAKAVTSFQTCVEQNPDYYDAHIQLGLLYATIPDDLALAYYDNALDIQPNSLEALYNKALYQQTRERFEEADQLYNRILAIDSTYYIAYYNKGYLRLVYTTDYDSSAYLFSKAISYDPNYFEAFYNRGYSYELAGNKKKALEDYQKALAIKPDFTLAAKGISRVSR